MSADLELMALPANPDHLARNIWDRVQSTEFDSLTSADIWKLRESLNAYPWIEVGQVSWVKAGMGDFERYVPGPIARTVDLIGEGVILTPGLAKAIIVAFNLPNRSIYGRPQFIHTRQRIDPALLEQFRRQSFPGQARRYPGTDPVFRRPNILRYSKGRGIASGRVVKRFLEANMGCYLVQESV